MNVDKVGRVGSGSFEAKKVNAPSKTESAPVQDNVTISSTAMQLAVEAKLKSEVKEITSNIMKSGEDSERIEKLKLVKEKLKNGEYDTLSPDTLEKIAEKITDVFLG